MTVDGHPVGAPVTAARRWHDQLQRWAIPEHILRAAPADPHRCSVQRFSALAADALRRRPTPTHDRAAEALPAAGSVLDVGCGGGAGSLPLGPPAARLVGVDQRAGMLDAFRRAAAARGVGADTVLGTWPDVAAATPVTDVVVSTHVLYNVPRIAPFLRALTAHARRRVVLELPTSHPLAWLTPYWRALHDLERPAGPTADDALQVMADLGARVRHQRWLRPNSLHGAPSSDQVLFVRERLGLAPDRDDEVRDLVDRIGVPAHRPVVTAWWDV